MAFLSTDFEITADRNAVFWPFQDVAHWRANQDLVNDLRLPEYDPAFHACPVNTWCNSIPSAVGFLILGVLLAAVLVAIALS